MMEKNKFLLLIVMLASFLFIGIVRAEGSCDTVELNKLRQEAANVKVTYIPNTALSKHSNEGVPDQPAIDNVLDLKVYNVTEKMALRYSYSGKGVTPGTFIKTYADVGSDGAITVRQRSYGMVINYVITIVSNYGSCSGQTLKTFRITLPIFNYYSILDICDGIQDYYLCQPYVTTPIDAATFFDKVETYRAKMLDNKVIDVEDDNNGIITATFTGVKKYKYLIVGVIVAAGVVATVLILKRKKSDAQ